MDVDLSLSTIVLIVSIIVILLLAIIGQLLCLHLRRKKRQSTEIHENSRETTEHMEHDEYGIDLEYQYKPNELGNSTDQYIYSHDDTVPNSFIIPRTLGSLSDSLPHERVHNFGYHTPLMAQFSADTDGSIGILESSRSDTSSVAYMPSSENKGMESSRSVFDVQNADETTSSVRYFGGIDLNQSYRADAYYDPIWETTSQMKSTRRGGMLYT